jgi:protein-tyrosine phosphatase
MIDLHNHILYGLDDGPETLTESLEMCRVGYGDGIRTIVATPHMLNGVYRSSRATLLTRVRELNTALKDSRLQVADCRIQSQPSKIENKLSDNSELNASNSELLILPGADVHLAEGILRHLKQDRLMTLGDGNRFILIEFPSQGVPYLAEKVLFQMIVQGIIPILSHPERNPEIGRKPIRYYEMIRMGCLGQVTAMSLTGGFGPMAKQLAEQLLIHRLVHVIATDAHSIEERPPILTPGVKAASRLVGQGEALRMVTEYPRAILEGKRPSVPAPIPF